MRRLLPTVAVLGAGLLLLWWGLATLQGIVVEERRETKALLVEARQTLAQYARRALQAELADSLHEREASLAAALDDPLLPSDGLLLIEGSTQVLPRAFAPGNATPGRELYVGLRAGDTDARDEAARRDPQGPWARRLALHHAVHQALQAGDDDGVRAAVREILEHRTRWVLPSVDDIPATLAMLDDLYQYATPHEGLLRTLLRDGIGEAAGASQAGLQRQLLARRDRFTEPDFRFLAGRVLALSTRAGVPRQDFEAQATAPAAPTVLDTAPPTGVSTGPLLLRGGRWYVETRPGTRLAGVATDLPTTFATIEQEMRDHGLLHDSDTIALPALGRVIAIADLAFSITAPRLDAAAQAADRRFSLKTTFVALSAALALVIAALAIVLQHRGSRFVELKSDFVATVSHELRTPLASIRLMAETLERRCADLPRARDYPTRIVREVDELAFLVENILSFNRLDKGRWTPRRSTVALGEVIEELVDHLPQLGLSTVEVSTQGMDGLLLWADRELLKLLLRNLIKNACTYNERSPVTLSLRAQREASGGLRLDVRDNGVGIAPQLQQRVFEDFQRGATSRARGSGLGLSICRKSVQAHGGRIAIEASSAEGTTFRIDLPASIFPPKDQAVDQTVDQTVDQG